MTLAADRVPVTYVPNPFDRATRRFTDVAIGSSVRAVVDQLGVANAPAESLRVWVGSAEWARERWDEPIVEAVPVIVRIVPNAFVVPFLLTALAQIATVATAFIPAPLLGTVGGIGAGIGGALGLGPIGITLLSLGSEILIGSGVTYGVSMLGSLATGALVKPQNGGFGGGAPTPRESPTLSGGSNQAYKYAPLPRIFGEHWFTFWLASKTFTETVGADNYLNMLCTAGYGPLDFEDFRIGNTPLSSFDGVRLQVRDGIDTYELDVKTGIRTPIAAIDMFKDEVDQEAIGVVFARPRGANDATEPSDFAIRSTSPDTEEVSGEIAFPQGLSALSSKGEKASIYVGFQFQAKPFGAPDAQYVPVAFKEVGRYATQYDSTQAIKPGLGGALTIPTPDGSGNLGADYAFTIGSVTGFFTVGDVLTWASGTGTLTAWNSGTGAATVHLVSGTAPSIGDSITQLAIFPAVPTGSGTVTTTPTRSGSGAAQSFPLPGPLGLLVVEAKSSDPFVTGFSFLVPGPKGQYTIRIRRLFSSKQNLGLTLFSDATWTTLRSIRTLDFPRMAEATLLALRVKASDQLSGAIDQFRAKCFAKFRPWLGFDPDTGDPMPGADSEGFGAYQRSRNAAWQFLHKLTSTVENPRPASLDRVDLARIQAWAQFCEPTPGNYNFACDHVKDYRGTTRQLLDLIAATSRASYADRDGKHSVVVDAIRDQPVGLITPRNSFGYRAVVRHVDFPHALRANQEDESSEDQLRERVVYRDGFGPDNATRFETLELPGVVRLSQGYRDARFHLKQGIARRLTHEVHLDWEGQDFERGDWVKLAHDVPLAESKAGLSKFYGVLFGAKAWIDLDEEVEFKVGSSYSAILRWVKDNGDGTSSSVLEYFGVHQDPAEVAGAPTRRLVLDVPVPNDVDHAWNLDALVAFGVTTQEVLDCVVLSTSTQADASVVLVLTAYAPEIFDEDPLPPDPAALASPLVRPPPIPELLDAARSVGDRVVVAFKLGAPVDVRSQARAVELQWRFASPVGPWNSAGRFDPALGAAFFVGEFDQHYDLRLRSIGDVAFSDWAYAPGAFLHERVGFGSDAYVVSFGIKDLGDSNEWLGEDLELEAQLTVVGYEGVGYPEGFGGFGVEIYDVDAAGNKLGLRRSARGLSDPRYSYSLQRNREDSLRLSNGTSSLPARALLVAFLAFDAAGIASAAAFRTCRNPAPPREQLAWVATIGGLNFSSGAPTDADATDLIIWRGATMGFAVDRDHEVFRGTDNPAFVDTSNSTDTWYRWARRDRFSDDPALLNVSDPVQIQPAGGVTDLTSWDQATSPISLTTAGADGTIADPPHSSIPGTSSASGWYDRDTLGATDIFAPLFWGKPVVLAPGKSARISLTITLKLGAAAANGSGTYGVALAASLTAPEDLVVPENNSWLKIFPPAPQVFNNVKVVKSGGVADEFVLHQVFTLTNSSSSVRTYYAAGYVVRHSVTLNAPEDLDYSNGHADFDVRNG